MPLNDKNNPRLSKGLRPEAEYDDESDYNNLEPRKGDEKIDDKEKESKKKGSLLKKDEKGKLDSRKFIDTEPTISEAVKKDTAVIAFGRMNPPTIGHEKLVNKVINEAISRNGDPLIYLSKTQDSDKNPLTYDQKMRYAKAFFGKNYIITSRARTIIEVAKELDGVYEHLVVVVGSDRLREFKSLMTRYNGKDYTFKTLDVISAGERDPDVEGATGMSASKMRAAAEDGDLKSFTKGVPSKGRRLASAMYNDVRKGLGMVEESFDDLVSNFLKERVVNGKLDPLSAMGKSKLTGGEVAQYYRNNPKAKAAARKPEVKLGIELALDLSGNYNYALKEIDKIKRNLSKHPEVQKALQFANESVNEELYKASTFRKRLKEEEDPDIKKRKGTQPKGYYAPDAKGDEMSKSTKLSRARHFEKGAKMDDDDPNAYKPAPGDATAKTKPSKYTNKFKRMFGENKEGAYLKRPHLLLRADKSVNFDYRFKMYRTAKEEEAREKQRLEIEAQIAEADPCWDGYKQVGMKKKGNKFVPNCVKEVNELADAVEFIFMNESKETDKVLKDKSEKTGISFSILKQVFDRGVAAWKSGHRPGTTPIQWGYARVNSFATGGKTQKTADADLWADHKGK